MGNRRCALLCFSLKAIAIQDPHSVVRSVKRKNVSDIRVALSEGQLAFVVLMAWLMAKMGARYDPADGRILVW